MSEQTETELLVLHPDDTIVSDALRDVDEGAVRRIVESFHVNLEAAKREGWQAVPVVVDRSVATQVDRELQGLIANNVRHAMNPLDAARVYKKAIESLLKANRTQARSDGYQLRNQEGSSANFAEDPSPLSIGISIANDGRSRSSVPLVTGFPESKINEAFQLQERAVDESAAKSCSDGDREGAGFLRVDAMHHLTSLPPEQRPKMPTAEERAEQTLDAKLTRTMIRLDKAVTVAEESFKAGDFVLWQGQTHHAAEFFAEARVLNTIARYLDPKHTVGVNPDDDH